MAKAESVISNLVHSRCNSKAQTIGIPWNVPVGHRELRIIANEVGPFCVSLQGEMFSEIGIASLAPSSRLPPRIQAPERTSEQRNPRTGVGRHNSGDFRAT